MPEEINGKNMAILFTKLDSIAEKQREMTGLLKELQQAAAVRDKQIVALETQMEDIMWLKRAFFAQIFGILTAIGLAAYAVIQHLAP